MDIQVEVVFTVRHSLEELKQVFVKRSHIPEWRAIPGAETRPLVFFEERIVSVTLSTERDRMAWLEFSIEACGELRRQIVIPNVVPSGINIDLPDLGGFLALCRQCLVSSPPER